MTCYTQFNLFAGRYWYHFGRLSGLQPGRIGSTLGQAKATSSSFLGAQGPIASGGGCTHSSTVGWGKRGYSDIRAAAGEMSGMSRRSFFTFSYASGDRRMYSGTCKMNKRVLTSSLRCLVIVPGRQSINKGDLKRNIRGNVRIYLTINLMLA